MRLMTALQVNLLDLNFVLHLKKPTTIGGGKMLRVAPLLDPAANSRRIRKEKEQGAIIMMVKQGNSTDFESGGVVGNLNPTNVGNHDTLHEVMASNENVVGKKVYVGDSVVNQGSKLGDGLEDEEVVFNDPKRKKAPKIWSPNFYCCIGGRLSQY